MLETKIIPNEPDQTVFVQFVRKIVMRFGPRSGQTVKVSERYVGASARAVSAEMGPEEAAQHPVEWRFLRGQRSGGDNPVDEPPWREFQAKVPAEQRDARASLERKVFPNGQEFRWYLLEGQAME